MANMEYQKFAVNIGIFDKPEPYTFQIYSEPLQKFQLAAIGHGNIQPPAHLRSLVKSCFTPLPIWYEPFEGETVSKDEFPLHALTQRPMAMYHSWGSQNPWLRQIHGQNPMFIPRKIASKLNLKDGDWIWVSSHHGKIRVPVFIMAGLNENTIWTWNAIGKRKGAWQLDENAPEAKKGFLLNHLIHELLPAKNDGQRWSNSDPITGQAAWFDLKVKITKASVNEPAESYPQFPPLPKSNGIVEEPSKNLRYGIEWTTNQKTLEKIK